MEQFDVWDLEKSFARFEKAAAKGHEEAIWVLSVVKDVEMDSDAWGEGLCQGGKAPGVVLCRKAFEFKGAIRLVQEECGGRM
jgi:hypothetical protein